MSAHPVRVIGAGIGGLAVGRALLKHGIPAVLYEQKTSIPRYNYSITLHPRAYRPLLDILDMDESAFRRDVAVDGPLGGTGFIDPDLVISKNDVSSSSIRAHRGRLDSLLREGLDIRWGGKLERIDETPEGNIMCMKSGQKINSSCIVAADGPHSTVRKFMSPGTTLKTLPIVAFNGKRNVMRSVFNRKYAPYLRSSNLIESKQNGIVLQVQVNDEHRAYASIGWVYSRRARGDSDALHRPDRPQSAATDIPEKFFQEVSALQDLPPLFEHAFNPKKLRLESQNNTHSANVPILHWLMRTALIEKLDLVLSAKKGIVFVGDAMHAEPIIGGQGANNAILDGVELADSIAKFGTKGLPEFYSTRYSSWEHGVEKSEEVIDEIHR